MSRESGQDRSQKTVAELLALHGGNADGNRRRRRRAAEDEDEQGGTASEISPRRRNATDTQTIIARVRGEAPNGAAGPHGGGGRRALAEPESGSFPRRQPPDSPRPPVQQDSAALPRPQGQEPFPRPHQERPNGRQAPEFPRPPQDSGTYPRPQTGRPQESGAFARPNQGPAQESGAFPHPNGAGFRENGAGPRENGAGPRDNGVGPRDNGAGPRDSGTFARPGGAGPQESGGFPLGGVVVPGRDAVPGRRVRPQDPAARRPPQDSGGLPLPEPPVPDEPPRRGQDTHAQLPPRRRAPQAPPGPPAPPPGVLSARLDGLEASAPGENAPPEPEGMASGAFPAPPRRRRRAAPPRQAEPHTEQFELIDPTADPAPGAPPAGLAGWRGRPGPAAAEDTEVGVMPVVRPGPPDPAIRNVADEIEATGFHDPFAEDDEEADEFDAFGEAGVQEELDDYDYEPEGEPDGHEEPSGDGPSPARQWLSMAVQLALGVVGGAGMWLGFNWLWGQLPAAALVVAVLVIVGLVWIVRRIRRADDIQTTVLAVLVGLVVTVSPAALLLLSR